MRLSLSIPKRFKRQPGGNRIALRFGDDGKPEAALEWKGVALLPDEQKRWVQQTLRDGLPSTVRVDIKSDETVATDTGWPLRLVLADALSSDGELLEQRLMAFYAFLEHAAVASFRSRVQPLFAQELEAVRSAMVSAKPDWSESVCALAQLWDVEPTSIASRSRQEPVAVPVTPPTDQTEDASSCETEVTRSIDTLFDTGLSRYMSGDFAGALEAWETAFEHAPNDFSIARKIVQANYALDRFAAADESRKCLLEIHSTSIDPAVRLAGEFVFDQFVLDEEHRELAVFASESLHRRNPAAYDIYAFRLVRKQAKRESGEATVDAQPEIQSVCVRVETSDYAKQRGVPYVVSVTSKNGYRVIGTSERLPPYPELRSTVRSLILAELASR